MVTLSRGIVGTLVEEQGRIEFLRRISDPFWFQCLSSTLGFDWHSSGTTTVVCGALKEALSDLSTGIGVAGGKGQTSRKTPQEIENLASAFDLSSRLTETLIYSSKMAAKVDSVALQDGHQLYHHCFFLTEDGEWSVVQQGMLVKSGYARRYHWLSESIESLVVEPHSAILGHRQPAVLDMTASESNEARRAVVDIAREDPARVERTVKLAVDSQTTLDELMNGKPDVRRLILPDHHHVDWEKLRRLYDFQPRNFEELLAVRGLGPRTMRSLVLISDLIYGAEPSWSDPVRYSFAVGGKDGVPYPVDRRVIEETTEVLEKGIAEARIGSREKLRALKRLRLFMCPPS